MRYNDNMMKNMKTTDFVVYNKKTTQLVGSKNRKWFRGLAAAKAHLTRMGKMGYRMSDYAISDLESFYAIEKTEEKVNLMTGKKFTQSVNTPRSCDPSTELYWTM